MVWYRYPDWSKHLLAEAQVELSTDMQLVDVDADGDLDVVVGDADTEDNVVWLVNPRPAADPGAVLWERRPIGTHGDYAHDIEALDIDGDGHLDVVARSKALHIWFGDGGRSWSLRDLSARVGGEAGLGAGDLDADGDPDLIVDGAWLENPGRARAAPWHRHEVIDPWNAALESAVGDFDDDGRADVAFIAAHDPEELAWLAAPEDPRSGAWVKHGIDSGIGSHKLNVADFDQDGRLDLQLGHERNEVAIYLNRGGSFVKHRVGGAGGHNARVGDIDRDGDIDIFGADYTGHPPVRVWRNRRNDNPPAEGTLPPGRWTAVEVTDDHLQTFGLAFGDVNRDGMLDIVSGRRWYRNPGGDMDTSWEAHAILDGMDACLALRVDDDDQLDLIAQADTGTKLYWVEAVDGADAWSSTLIGELPPSSHVQGSQGYLLADVQPGGRPEVLFSSGAGLFYFEIPDRASETPWPRTRIAGDSSDEGIAVGDIDRDGLLDVAATTGESKLVQWYRNPGDRSADWAVTRVGEHASAVYPDRIAVADFDSDGRLDIVVTEENGAAEGAETLWWEQPDDPSISAWRPHLVVSQASTNSLSAADIDRDGDTDLILGEHKGHLKMSLWINDGRGEFVEQILTAGRESHLGARVVDLDRDGDLDIVSIAWDAFRDIYLWRNDAAH